MARLFLCIVFLMASVLPCNATHLIGGEIFYECLGNNQWKIGMVMYRDCHVTSSQGADEFDDFLNIAVYDASNNDLIDKFVLLPDTVEHELPLILNAPCLQDTPNVCVARLTYSRVMTIEIPSAGAYIVNQRCCRTNDALNLQAPSDAFGSTYFTFIPDPTIHGCNDSPKFNEIPPKILCAGIDVDLDYSATDPDGDSLVYSWCNPYHGGGQSTGSNGGPNSPLPNIPTPPPYTSVVWNNGFNTNYQLPSNPAMDVDDHTGLISGRPTQVGTYVSSICVKEYRNGINISETRRDFQLSTTICEISAFSAIDSALDECIGFEVDFYNLSSAGDSFLWDFGEPHLINDTSSSLNPSWLFSDTGTYEITLIAFNNECNDTSSIHYRVLPKIEADFEHSEPECFDRHQVNLKPKGYYKESTKMYWRFDNDTVRHISDSLGFDTVRFESPGDHEVVLIYDDFGCIKKHKDTVTVWPNPELSLIDSNNRQCAPFKNEYTADSKHAFKPNYTWIIDSHDLSNNSPSAFIELTDTGYHDIEITMVTDSLCIDTVKLSFPKIIRVLDTPSSAFGFEEYERGMFTPDFNMFDLSLKSEHSKFLIEDSLLTRDRSYSFSIADTGNYTVTQIVTHENGCRDTSSQIIRVAPEYVIYIPNAFSPDGDVINNIWLPKVYVETEYLLQVFDRWGKVVFETTDSKQGWDGNFIQNGQPCPIGVYSYNIQLIDDELKEWFYNGTVTLFR